MALSIRERIATVSLDGMTEEQLKVMRSLAYFAESHADNLARSHGEAGSATQAASFEKLAETCSDLWWRAAEELKELSRG